MHSLFRGILLAFSCLPLCLGGTEDKKKIQELRSLADRYPVLEEQVLKALPRFGTYCTAIDKSLIEQYVSKVEQLLNQETVTVYDKRFIKKIALYMTRGTIHRNASADSRWRNRAKQAIVIALSKKKEGMVILESLAAKNAQLQAEIEAYCQVEND